MRNLNLLWIIIAFSAFLISLHAEVELFRTEKLELIKSSHPWADELYLEAKGIASSKIRGGFLTVSIFFEKNKIRWFDIVIPQNGDAEFDKKWGPLNSATQELQAGEYKVKLEFILENQSQKLFEETKKLLGGDKIKNITKSFQLGNKVDLQEEITASRNFYLNIMKSTNKMLESLIKQRNDVFNSILKKQRGEYLRNWRLWVRDHFLVEIEKNKKELEKRDIQFFALRYPTTKHNMVLYCQLLKEIAINYTYSFQSFENSRGGEKYKSPYTLKELSKIMLHIRLLHEEGAKEMEVDLDKELGYTPPPPNTF